MFLDARQIPAGTRLDCDLCIIGGGAAGITTAREFIGKPFKVILLESGGMEFSEETQSLYEGRSIGLDYDLSETRVRYFGGSTNHWWGNCRPLDEIDFQKRDWIPHSGWPITRKELLPFYRRAASVIRLGEMEDFEWEGARADSPYPALEFESGKLVTRILQESRGIRFREVYGPEIKRAENVHAYLQANALEIVPEAASAGKIETVRASTLAGNEFSISARAYVLAASGIENARLLLNSDSVQKKGLGNARGVVGRYFMEHPILEFFYVPSSRDLDLGLYRYYVRKPIGNTQIWSMLAPSESLMRERRLPSAGATLHGTVSEAVYGLDGIRRHMKGRGMRDLGDHIRSVAADLDGVARYFYERKMLGKERHEMQQELYLFATLFEQVPDPENRVVLSEDRDRLGLRRSELHLKLTDYDRQSFLQLFELFASEIGAEGYGRLKIPFDPEKDEWPIKFWDHQIGTTRMHEDPARGVVDPQSRVHDSANLYVAGSSVFPTGGFAPPTMTLVALALRLSDHLKKVLA